MFRHNFIHIVTWMLTLMVIFIVGKVGFTLYNLPLYSHESLGDVLRALVHGLPMDLSVTAYLTIYPLLAYTAHIWLKKRGEHAMERGLQVYAWIVAALISLALVCDAALYPYWHMKLDATPVFYFFTSPKAAMASLTWLQVLVGTAALVVCTLLLGLLLSRVILNLPEGYASDNHHEAFDRPTSLWLRIVTTLGMAVLGVGLFIAMRGGVTVSTMNPSSAYFSHRQRMNHMAVNPVFSFAYSASHQRHFNRQFRYFTPEENQRIYRRLTAPLTTTMRREELALTDTLQECIYLKTPRPDIYIMILEGFSSHLFPSLGGENIAMRLDSIGREGVMFTNFYAAGPRTDRGLAAIIAGYPSPPTTSILKYTAKTERMPTFTRQLREAGYDLRYYYGGDVGFTNMKSFLVNAGFTNIVTDKDFPIKDRISKWGVPDHILFERVMQDSLPGPHRPTLKIVQTSSSHEPFDVPVTLHPDERINAFMYADHVVAEWVNTLQRTPRWNNSLVVILSDHWGVYPQDFTEIKERFHIPLILTGGALAHPEGLMVDKVGSQVDLGATILRMLDLEDNLPFSYDLRNPENPQFAFFSNATAAGLVTKNSTATVDVTSGMTIDGSKALADAVRAYLQTLYDDIENL